MLYNLIGSLNGPEKRVEKFISVLTDITSHAISICNRSENFELRKRASIVLYFFQVFCQKMEQKSKENDFQSGAAKSVKKGAKSKKSALADDGDNHTFDWQYERKYYLNILEKIAAIESINIWEMGVAQENFYLTMWKFAIHLLEIRPFEANSNTSNQCVSIITSCIQKLHSSSSFETSGKIKSSKSNSSRSCLSPMVAAMVSSMTQTEKITPFSRDIVSICVQSPSVFTSSLLTDICNFILTDNGSSTVKTLAKNAGEFLVTLAELSAETVAPYMSLIIELIDCDEYLIR